GLHPDDHGLGVQHTRDGSGGRDHPTDEAVHDLEGGDVDHDALRAGPHDLVAQVVLQCDGDVVLQIDLDGDQQDPADAQDRDLVHQLPAAGRFTTSRP